LAGFVALRSPAARKARPWLRRTAVISGPCLGACILPWTVRNAAVAHRLIPLATSSSWSASVSAQQYLGLLHCEITQPEWRQITAAHERRHAQAREEVAAGAAAARAGRGSIAAAVAEELEVEDGYRAEAAASFARLTLPRLLAGL